MSSAPDDGVPAGRAAVVGLLRVSGHEPAAATLRWPAELGAGLRHLVGVVTTAAGAWLWRGSQPRAGPGTEKERSPRWGGRSSTPLRVSRRWWPGAA